MNGTTHSQTNTHVHRAYTYSHLADGEESDVVVAMEADAGGRGIVATALTQQAPTAVELIKRPHLAE